MKLSLPDISIRPCLRALVLILPAPAAHAAPLTFFANLSGANEGMTIFRWSSQLGWLLDSPLDMPFVRLFPCDIVEPQ